MGKPTGFIEYLREIPVDRPPLERVRDWKEFHLHMEEKKLRNQGARCMDCGIPFCHTGKLTGSDRAWAILAGWTTYESKFVRVIPKDYQRMLACL